MTLGIGPIRRLAVNEDGTTDYDNVVEVWCVEDFSKRAGDKAHYETWKKHGYYDMPEFNKNTRKNIYRGAREGHFTIAETKKILKNTRNSFWWLIEPERWQARKKFRILKRARSKTKIKYHRVNRHNFDDLPFLQKL